LGRSAPLVARRLLLVLTAATERGKPRRKKGMSFVETGSESDTNATAAPDSAVGRGDSPPQDDAAPRPPGWDRGKSLPPDEPGRLLVVDDDQTACEMLAAALGRQHRVTWRTSGHDALELAGNEDFDVVLTDLNLVDIPGLELCQRMI